MSLCTWVCYALRLYLPVPAYTEACQKSNPSILAKDGECGALQRRGCPLRGLHATPSLQAHEHRFIHNCWSQAHATDLDTIYRQHIDPADKRRLSPACLRKEKMEMLKFRVCLHLAQKVLCHARTRGLHAASTEALSGFCNCLNCMHYLDDVQHSAEHLTVATIDWLLNTWRLGKQIPVLTRQARHLRHLWSAFGG